MKLHRIVADPGDQIEIVLEKCPPPTIINPDTNPRTLVGFNVEEIGNWRGSTPFKRLIHQGRVEDLYKGKIPVVNGQDHLKGTRVLNGDLHLKNLTGQYCEIIPEDLGELDGTAREYYITRQAWRNRFANGCDILRFNATALRLNEERASTINHTEHFGGIDGINPHATAAMCRELGAVPWVGPGYDWETLAQAYMADVFQSFDEVLLELGNEGWNGQYPQARSYMAQNDNDFKKAVKQYANESQALRDLWTSAGLTNHKLVYNTQFRNPWVASQMLEEGAPDVLAIAPYFGRELGLPSNYNGAKDLNLMTDDEVFSWLQDEVDGLREMITAHADLAENHGIQLAAYEGGPHLFPIGTRKKSTEYVQRLQALQEDERMKSLLDDHYADWKRLVIDRGLGGSYCAFKATDVKDREDGFAGTLDSLYKKESFYEFYDSCSTEVL